MKVLFHVSLSIPVPVLVPVPVVTLTRVGLVCRNRNGKTDVVMIIIVKRERARFMSSFTIPFTLKVLELRISQQVPCGFSHRLF